MQMSSGDYGCLPRASCCHSVQDATIPKWIRVHISMLAYSVYTQLCVISKYVWAIGFHLLRVLKHHNRNHTSEAFLSQATVLPLCCRHLPGVFKNTSSKITWWCMTGLTNRVYRETGPVSSLHKMLNPIPCIFGENLCLFVLWTVFSFRGWGLPSEDSLALWSPPPLLAKKAIIHTVVQLSWVEEDTPAWKAAGSLLYH